MKREKKEEKEFSLGREIFEWFYTIAVALVIAFVIKGFVFDIVEVDGSSMDPTLVDNDRLIVTKLGYNPKQGDIVILDSTYKKREAYYEEENGEDMNALSKMIAYMSVPKDLKIKYYVKRVIALEGQTVDIKDGKVWIDGEVLEEEYYDGVTDKIDPNMEFPLTVDEGHVFVMGDNRPRSLDSRDSSLGQVPKEAVIGKSVLRVWPIDSIGTTK